MVQRKHSLLWKKVKDSISRTLQSCFFQKSHFYFKNVPFQIIREFQRKICPTIQFSIGVVESNQSKPHQRHFWSIKMYFRHGGVIIPYFNYLLSSEDYFQISIASSTRIIYIEADLLWKFNGWEEEFINSIFAVCDKIL